MCRHWSSLGIASAVGFAVLERSGYTGKGCHPTLSRRLKFLLGDRGAWLFTAAGLCMTWHLITLPPLTVEETPC